MLTRTGRIFDSKNEKSGDSAGGEVNRVSDRNRNTSVRPIFKLQRQYDPQLHAS